MCFTLTISSSEPLSQEKQDDVYWVLQTVLRTIDRASEEGKLFTFVPDFYVDVCINSINALTGYFHPTVPYTSLPGKLHICLSDCRNWKNPLFGHFQIMTVDGEETEIKRKPFILFFSRVSENFRQIFSVSLQPFRRPEDCPHW